MYREGSSRRRGGRTTAGAPDSRWVLRGAFQADRATAQWWRKSEAFLALTPSSPLVDDALKAAAMEKDAESGKAERFHRGSGTSGNAGAAGERTKSGPISQQPEEKAAKAAAVSETLPPRTIPKISRQSGNARHRVGFTIKYLIGRNCERANQVGGRSQTVGMFVSTFRKKKKKKAHFN